MSNIGGTRGENIQMHRTVTGCKYKACPSESGTEVGAPLSSRGPMGQLFQPTR
jgi:hypothetical protein